MIHPKKFEDSVIASVNFRARGNSLVLFGVASFLVGFTTFNSTDPLIKLLVLLPSA